MFFGIKIDIHGFHGKEKKTKEQLLVLFDYPNNHGSVESAYENVCFEILKSPVKPVRKHKASDKVSLSVTLTYKEKMKMIEIAQKKIRLLRN